MATKSRTFSTSGLPGVVKDHYKKTTISDGSRSRSGVGKTAEQSQKAAKKAWESAKKKP